MIDALCSGLGTLKYLVASSLSEACNNSVLLLRPRGCGKAAIRLNGMLHSDDNCATKASSDDNTEFMIDMLRAWERPKLMFDLKQTGSFLH
uniref:Uncharacterized protein n=1 Tax=Oryza glumipatula TaxID=40148 RepID=A0A0E0BLD1_9ORYZ